MFSQDQILLYKNIFKGREDVFAVRWEKNGKNGYMPAYDLDLDEYAKHKASGGTLKDFANKTYSRLTEQRIINHLTGKETIGVYPLLENNTSRFIVADFDQASSGNKKWTDECKLFINACAKHKLPAYLERSRSGNGGHVWIFFEQNYPAYESRKILLHILESSGIISPFDKNSNYDRLFPNQDSHSGKGLGNLIALPLQKKALENDNSCFIAADSLLAFSDQWIFLASVQKVPVQILDEIFNSITNTSTIGSHSIQSHESGALQILLNNQIVLRRNQLKSDLISFLKEHLNFINSDYIIKKKLGKNTFGTEVYFKMLEEKDGLVFIPRGFIGKLLRYCNEQNIAYQLKDERKKLTSVNFSFKASLNDYQQMAVDATNKKDIGIIVAPPGSGKTIMGLAIVAQRKQPALIIVHRKQLFDQWIERIQSFLGIAEPFIGKIAQGQIKTGTHITVAMIQSIGTNDTNHSLFKSFGTIIVDECHHIPAKTFREVIKNFNAYYLYGLTATPIRKNNDEKLIFIHIGDVIHEVKLLNESRPAPQKLSVIVRETNLTVPFDYKTDSLETLSKILIHDSGRNGLIVEDIKTEANSGRKVLVLTERKAHIDVIYQYLKSRFEIITISGEDSKSSRKIKLKQIAEGHFQILISTGQFLGEGADIDGLDCLMLAYPFAFEGKLIQYIGRIQRGELVPVIYDYRDIYIDYLEKMFRQRNRYYQKLVNARQLQKFDELLLNFNEDKVFLNSGEIILPMSSLDLPDGIEKFKDDIAWKLRVLNTNDETGELMTEITDYRAQQTMNFGGQTSLQFLTINKIKFRSIDTSRLLNAVKLRSAPIQEISEAQAIGEPDGIYQPSKSIATKPIERTLVKTMRVPFYKVQFLHACVSFPLFIEELGTEVKFEIDNPDIRPEFEAIKDYFAKALKKKLITVAIEIRYNAEQILSSMAKSDDVDKINNTLIDCVKFEFVKREIFSFRGKKEGSGFLHTLDSLVAATQLTPEKIFKSDQELIDEILNVKNSKHFHQIKYLSSQHLSSILKVRFILDPFSFLFLLTGEKNYYIVWETLNSEEATYIWHFKKSIEALRQGLNEIEIILNDIKNTSKQDYLKKDHLNFSRIVHDYSDTKKGFVAWKCALEERLT